MGAKENISGKKLEKLCNSFLIENFYKKVLRGWDIETITNAEMQKVGIDVQIRKEGRIINIEEKCPQTHINDPVRNFMLETSVITSVGQILEGWFTNPFSETDFYLFYEIVTEDSINVIRNKTDIRQLNVVVVNSWDLTKKIQELTKKSLRELYMFSNEVRKTGHKRFGNVPGWFYRQENGDVSICVRKAIIESIACKKYIVKKIR